MSKKRFLKSLIATSALAAALLPAQAALGANNATTGDPANMNTGANLTGAYTASDTIQLGGAHDITANKANAVYGVDVDTNDGQTLTLSEDNTITGIDNDVAETIDITFGAAKTLTLSGVANGEIAANTYDGIGTISLAGKAGTVALSATSATIGPVDTTTANTGTLTITGTGNTVGVIGNAAALKAVNITAGKGATTLGNTTSNQVTISGATAVTTGTLTVAGATLAADGDAVTTGAGLLTLTGVANIGATGGRLNIGAGGITTDNDVTLGAGGSTGTGKLTVTADKTLSIAGDYAATGGIVAASGNTVTVHAAGTGVKTVSSAITGADNTSKLTVTGADASSVVKVTEDIGTSGVKLNQILVSGGHGRLLLDGKDAYATTVLLDNAGSELQFSGSAEVHGNIKADGAGNGILVLKGASSAAGGTTTKLDTTNAFAAFTVDAGATDSTLTIGAVAGSNPTFNAMNFKQASGDNSGIVFDLSGLGAGNAYTVTTGGAVAVTNGVAGSIKFANSTNTNDVTLVLGGNVGASNVNSLKTIDATGQKLTISGVHNMHVSDIFASELTLNGVSLGMYNTPGASAPSKINVTTADVTILENSNLPTGVTVNFATNHKLSLAKNVDLTGAATATTTGQGKISLAEGNTLSMTLGTSAKPLALVEFTGAAATSANVISKSDMHVTALDFNNPNSGTINLTGNLLGNVTTQTANKGTLVLKGGNVTGSVGANGGNALAGVTMDTTGTVEFGSNITAKRDVNTNAVTFSQDGTLNLHKNVTNVHLGAVTTATNDTGSLVYNQTATTDGDIGTATHALKNVTIGENSTLNVAAGNTLHATNVVTATDSQGTLAFAGASVGTNTVVGSSAKKFLAVSTDGAGAEVDLGSVYADTLTVGADSTLKVKNVETTNGIAGTGTISVKDNGTIGKTTAASTVSTAGSATLTGDLAGTLTLAGPAGSVVTFSGSTITGLVTNANGSTLELSNDVAMTAGYTGTNSLIDFGANTVTVGAGNTFALTGNTTMALSGTATPIVADTFTTANAADVVTVQIEGLAKGGITLAKKSDGTAVIMTAGGGATDAANFAIAGNEFVKSIAYDNATGVLTPTYESDVANVATAAQKADPRSLEFMKTLVAHASGSDAADEVVSNLVATYTDLTTDQKNKVVKSLAEQNVGAVADSSVAALDGAFAQMDARTNMAAAMAADAKLGVAAGGDASDRFGVWGDLTFGNATQKLRKSTPGYKATSYGAHVGVDTMLNDHMSVGLVLGNANNILKHKDAKAGDKTKANSWMFGAYGTYNLADNYFVQANAALAQTSVKANRQMLGATATGKYDAMAYAAEVRGGYRYRFDNAALVPTAGLRFNHLGDTSYTEKGGAVNKKVASKAASSISAVAGLSLSTALDMNGMAVTPEVHMNVDYALSNRAPKATYNLDGSTVKFAYKGDKPGKFAYNFGASAMAKQDNMEYGVGYDARIADKYVGHQGSVKVKLSF